MESMERAKTGLIEWDREKGMATFQLGRKAQTRVGAKKIWVLTMGCHAGTLMSRDQALIEYHNSLEKCKQAVQKAERSWAVRGYVVWFARAVGPDGQSEELRPGNNFYEG